MSKSLQYCGKYIYTAFFNILELCGWPTALLFGMYNFHNKQVLFPHTPLTGRLPDEDMICTELIIQKISSYFIGQT